MMCFCVIYPSFSYADVSNPSQEDNSEFVLVWSGVPCCKGLWRDLYNADGGLRIVVADLIYYTIFIHSEF